MAIVDDYKNIGQRYHELSDPWLPIEKERSRELCPSGISETTLLERVLASLFGKGGPEQGGTVERNPCGEIMIVRQ